MTSQRSFEISQLEILRTQRKKNENTHKSQLMFGQRKPIVKKIGKEEASVRGVENWCLHAEE